MKIKLSTLKTIIRETLEEQGWVPGRWDPVYGDPVDPDDVDIMSTRGLGRHKELDELDELEDLS